MTKYYLYLLQVMGAANPRTLQLIRHFGGVKQAAEAVMDGDRGFLKEGEKKAAKTASLDKSEMVMELCAKRDYRIMLLSEEDYPFLLKNIYNPPMVLFVMGEASALSSEIPVTIVGTREPSTYSIKSCRQLCSDLARLDTTLVSGLANGLDSVAHRAALENGARTVGVLACGTEVDYPRGSALFHREIARSGGAVVSELLPYTEATRQYFHQRNRLMSGLSLGTVVVEADQHSGCLITANFAVSQNRDLFIVSPPDSYSPRYRGNIRYLREGAVAVYDYTDVAKEYYSRYSEKRRRLIDQAEQSSVALLTPEEELECVLSQNSPAAKAAIRPARERNEANPTAEPKIMPEAAPKPAVEGLTEDKAKIAEALSEPMTMDDIEHKTGLCLEKLSELLLDMELDGIIESLPGSRYGLV